ncbi:glycosyltransferase family 4 protein [uncultured Limnobacter sp.]|uniref:glycosyltransferase family 4 protein n=1 Tax=uncultured Limnobacter sp. TaxID=199681 RepID=UPI0026376CAC|nr:glycosyltransferase family 4 protein [uncultured Limnobacter sp.]
MKHKHYYLKENFHSHSDGYNFIHNNLDIWKVLNKNNPHIVVTTGYNPSHLYAFIWSVLKRKRHVCLTDGTISSESHLSFVHKIIRKIFFFRTHAFIGASNKSIELFLSYGIPRKEIFRSGLCADNSYFSSCTYTKYDERPFDLIFSGQFHERKLPFLFTEICKRVNHARGGCRIILIGDGPLREEILEQLSSLRIEFDYPGFVQQELLPKYYSAAKVLLFTTRLDPWGVVANEAMAAGTPVITTPYAGVAGELVIDGVTGAVCEPDAEIWTSAAMRLLEDRNHWELCSANAREIVASYTYEAAAAGIEAACEYALGR